MKFERSVDSWSGVEGSDEDQKKCRTEPDEHIYARIMWDNAAPSAISCQVVEISGRGEVPRAKLRSVNLMEPFHWVLKWFRYLVNSLRDF